MTMTSTSTRTESYSVLDIETVMRRVTTDLVMIASSSGALSETEARNYGHDIELLAKNGYLKKVDVTLMSGVAELRAACYEVNVMSGDLSTSRPGGVMWPKIENSNIRIILFYTTAYTTDERQKMAPKLKNTWGPTSADTSHSSLTNGGNRDYSSNGWAMQRKDYTQ